MDRKPASANTFERCPECEYRLPNHSYNCSVKKRLGRRDFLKKIGAISAVAGIGGAGFLLGEANAIPSNTNSIIEPGSMVLPYDYVMFYDGTNWFAVNGRTGALDVKNSDFVTALIAAKALGGLSFFVKPPSPWAVIPLSASIPLTSGMTLRGIFPNTGFATVGPHLETVVFSSGTVFAYDGVHAVDAFTGTAVQNCVVGDIGISGFTANNGFNIGGTNTLGFLQSTLERIVFANVALPIKVINFQYFTLRQIYAWNPTTNFILAQMNNTTLNLDGGGVLNGGNSQWDDIYCHGCKNVNGAITIQAISGSIGLMNINRPQINQQDSANGPSTSGYAIYLQGQSATAICEEVTILGADLEGNPANAIRVEDWSFHNHLEITLTDASAKHFSLKKNLTLQGPQYNLLVDLNGSTSMESDFFENILISTGVLASQAGGFWGMTLQNFGANTNMALLQPRAFGYSTGSVGGAFTSSSPASVVTSGGGPNTQNHEIGGHVNITAYTSGTIQVQVSYTDEASNARTVIVPLCKSDGTVATGANALGDWAMVKICIRAKNATNIVIATIGTFTATYNVSGFITPDT